MHNELLWVFTQPPESRGQFPDMFMDIGIQVC